MITNMNYFYRIFETLEKLLDLKNILQIPI